MSEPASPARRRLEVAIRGRVQGVGFRYFVAREATRLRLEGWVANEGGGGVRCIAEGPETDLVLLLEALRAGPPAAIVSSVAEHWMTPAGGFRGFEIRSGSTSGD